MDSLSKFSDDKSYKPKGDLYLLLYELSQNLIQGVSSLKSEKSLIEGILLFTAACRLCTRTYLFISTDVLKPLMLECLSHINHANVLYNENKSNFNFIENRLDIYEYELIQIFSERNEGEGPYIDGIITYLIFENPLTSKIEYSNDLFKYAEILPKIALGAKKAKEFIKSKYDTDLEKDEFALETYEGIDQICIMCGGAYSVIELRKIRFTDIEFGSLLVGYACESCSKRLSETDNRFQYLD